jgi:tetratricopeptide (TPR) repeat protein
MSKNITKELSAKGYWPAIAQEYFNEGKYARVVELCNLRLRESPDILSGRIILARALYGSGQIEAAARQFYEILKREPENLTALKYLGDIKFQSGDEITALSYYEKVLDIDPLTDCLSQSIVGKEMERTKVLTLKKKDVREKVQLNGLREMPFKTETIGDLLLAQGHPRLAIDVFTELAKSGNPRLKDKLNKAREILNKQKG